MGAFHFGFWNLFKLNKEKQKMIEFIPYFGALITLIFSAGFAYAVSGGFDRDEKNN